MRFCSAVLAAACHRPEWDDAAHEKQVQWGEVVSLRAQGDTGEIVGHCCLTSEAAVAPEEEKSYM